MPTFTDFDQPAKQNKGGAGGGKNGFLKLQVGPKYRVRLISRPVRYFQHWDPVVCRSPGVETDPLMAMGYEPKPRYAIWVIDRADGQFKVMDFPESLYSEFAKWKSAFNDDPGGPKGPDWQITLDCPTGNKKQTKYSAIGLDRAPLTEGELDFIKKNNLKAKLEELRRDNTPEEIKQMMASGGAKSPAAPKTNIQASRVPSQNRTPAALPTAPAPSAESHDFLDDDMKF